MPFPLQPAQLLVVQVLGNLCVDRAAMERELLHALALGPKTHSELEAQAGCGDSPAHAATFNLVSPFCWTDFCTSNNITGGIGYPS